MSVEVIVGDCREVLSGLAPNSVQTCITSPPYFGLRDYGTAAWFGGNADCDHQIPASYLGGSGNKGHNGSLTSKPYKSVCKKCGATREDRQIGLETTVDDYVAELIAVFREVRRVLRDDGTLWLNLGDSYASPGGVQQPHRNNNGGFAGSTGKRTQAYALASGGFERPSTIARSVKPKDLIGVPWRVAFALQADGWYLRSDIIWHKPNPMPESVRDRPTKAHEYIFLLAKSERYFYDADAASEPVTASTVARIAQPNLANQRGSDRAVGKTNGTMKAVVRKQDQLGKATYTGFNERYFSKDSKPTRNRRTVWTVTTKPFKGAHFATFPPDLIEPCIMAGSRPGDTILDPFGGAGTSGLVANRLGRNAVLVELNPAYAEMARERIYADAPLFSGEGAA